MKSPIRILQLEDDPSDAGIVRYQLAKDSLPCHITVVGGRPEFEAALAAGPWDVILCDYNIPAYDGLAALKQVRQLHPAVPVIMLSGNLGPEDAVECIRNGATDYLFKERAERLPSAVRRAIEQAEEHERRVLAEMAQRESEARFRLMAENSHEAFWFIAFHPERLTYVSPAAGRIWGVPVTKFYDDPNFWLASIHPEDRGRVQEAYEGWLAGACERFEQEYRVIRADGAVRWVLDSGTLARAGNGTIIGVSGIGRDITERKEAEQTMRQAMATLDAIDDAVFIFDPETLRFSYVNEGAVRQLGYSRDELLGMTPLQTKPEFSAATYREMLAPMLRGEVRAHRFTAMHRCKDGHDIPVEAILQYIASGSAGDSPWFIAIVRDITERLKRERLAQRSQRLEALGTLSSGVAHDLNNALAPILMGIELLVKQQPDQARIADLIRISTRRAADMVRQLLTFSRGAEGVSVVVRPRDALSEVRKMIQATFPKNIAVDVHCERSLPCVQADPTQLHQVLLNLCVNARDAMPNGGTLALSAMLAQVDTTFASSIPDAKPGRYVVWCVRDTGTGIAPEIVERIFDPFFTTKGPDKGTGLGLSTVIGIVKGYGGFVQVVSRVAHGSTFSFYLPVATATDVIGPVPTRSAPAFRGSGECILFVDDEAVIREVAHQVLVQANFEPLFATDGVDGLIKATEKGSALHAVVTDMYMPHMDGLSFTRALRRMLPNIPVLVMSGQLEPAVAEEFRALGVRHFLNKPFTEAQLLSVLAEILAAKTPLNGMGLR